MVEKSELNEVIKKICDDYSLHIETNTEDSYEIFTDHSSGLTLFLKFDNQINFSFYFLQRTYDIVYNGDRSDVHVVLSLMFSSFLRLFDSGISCSLFDIPHPVIVDEIWGRYIMPEQTPSLLGISTSKKVIEAVSKIIKIVALWRGVFWEFAGCPCEECLKSENIDNSREYRLPKEIVNSVKKLYKSSSRVNYGNRIRPNWYYYYDMENEVTIIKSNELSEYLSSIHKFNERNIEKVEGINGTFLIDNEINNFIDNKTIDELNKLTMSLWHGRKPIRFSIIPLENMIISVGKPYIIALGRLSGLYAYKIERELLRKRHNRESELLFPIPKFDWQELVCPDQFEKLIKSLLEREPNVKTVRRPAAINQGDKGRDLIIEWNVRNENVISDTQPPTSIINVVGQCKVSKSTVGKSKVLDIRDTVETHNANGYFLAVSTQITAPLTEKLEELRSKGIWTFWWNKEDIEMRLSKNQDLLPQFPGVLKSKHTVKFIEK